MNCKYGGMCSRSRLAWWIRGLEQGLEYRGLQYTVQTLSIEDPGFNPAALLLSWRIALHCIILYVLQANKERGIKVHELLLQIKES